MGSVSNIELVDMIQRDILTKDCLSVFLVSHDGSIICVRFLLISLLYVGHTFKDFNIIFDCSSDIPVVVLVCAISYLVYWMGDGDDESRSKIMNCIEVRM